MLTRNIAIFVNGNDSIGKGHLIRCLSIVNEEIFKSYRILFLVPKDCKKKIIENKGFNCCTIRFDNENEVVNILRHNQINLLLIDLILEDYEKLKYLINYRNNFFITTITLFDFKNEIRYEHLSFFPDFVDDFETKIQNENIITQKLTGRNYIVINHVDESTELESGDILVSMGAADEFGLTIKTVKAIKSLNYNSLVILDEKHKDYSQIIKIVGDSKNIKIILTFVSKHQGKPI